MNAEAWEWLKKLARSVHGLPESYGAGLATCPGCNAPIWQKNVGHREGCWFEDTLRLAQLSLSALKKRQPSPAAGLAIETDPLHGMYPEANAPVKEKAPVSTTQKAVSAGHPMMKAWKAFESTDEFKSALEWATRTKYEDGRPIDALQQEQHAKGAMWLAFTKSWVASERTTLRSLWASSKLAPPRRC